KLIGRWPMLNTDFSWALRLKVYLTHIIHAAIFTWRWEISNRRQSTSHRLPYSTHLFLRFITAMAHHWQHLKIMKPPSMPITRRFGCCQISMTLTYSAV